MGVYTYSYNCQTLKVGKAGPKSKARFSSHHYSPQSSRSNLASSLLRGGERFGLAGFDFDTVGDWIKTNTHRVNFLLAQLGDPILNLFEAFVQCRLNPIFEGFSRDSLSIPRS